MRQRRRGEERGGGREWGGEGEIMDVWWRGHLKIKERRIAPHCRFESGGCRSASASTCCRTTRARRRRAALGTRDASFSRRGGTGGRAVSLQAANERMRGRREEKILLPAVQDSRSSPSPAASSTAISSTRAALLAPWPRTSPSRVSPCCRPRAGSPGPRPTRQGSARGRCGS